MEFKKIHNQEMSSLFKMSTLQITMQIRTRISKNLSSRSTAAKKINKTQNGHNHLLRLVLNRVKMRKRLHTFRCKKLRYKDI